MRGHMGVAFGQGRADHGLRRCVWVSAEKGDGGCRGGRLVLQQRESMGDDELRRGDVGRSMGEVRKVMWHGEVVEEKMMVDGWLRGDMEINLGLASNLLGS